MRYWRPAPRHTGLVSGYHLYAVEPQSGEPQSDVFQPAWPMLRFVFGAPGNWRVRPPGGDWQAVGEAALFGPTGGVTWSESGHGAVAGIGIMPLGWSRLTSARASDWADRIGSPHGVIGGRLAEVADELKAIGRDDDVPAIFDRLLDAALAPPGVDDGAIAALEACLIDPSVATVHDLSRIVDRSVRSIERLCHRAFGFSPKLLMRRARFLRSLHAVAAAPATERASAIDPGYTDYSHFARDAQSFLGMSPQAFLKLDTPLLRQSLALRQSILGAPAQALASDARG
jgi:AraC-like DNA-binding protein